MNAIELQFHFIVPLIAAVTYVSLFSVIMTSRPLQTHHKFFIVYLLSAIVWSSSDFLLRSHLLMDYKMVLFKIVVGSSILWITQLYCFLISFSKKGVGHGIIIGYSALVAFIVMAILGHAPPSMLYESGRVIPQYGFWFYIYLLPLIALPVLVLISLVKLFRISNDIEKRNKILYLLIALGILIVFGYLGVSPATKSFPFSHLGGLLSAFVLTYSIVNNDLLSVNFVMRRVIGYLSLALTGAAIFLALFIFGRVIFGYQITNTVVFVSISLSLLSSSFIFWWRPKLLHKIDQLFYRQKYQYRQELSEFVLKGIGGIYNLQELGKKLLMMLVKAVVCRQAFLLLPDSNTGDFKAQFSEPHFVGLSELTISNRSPLMEWLKNEYLTKKNIDIDPHFRGLWVNERELLKKFNIEIMFPLINRGKLIGIIAFAKNESGNYSYEDVSFLKTITGEIAINLEKEYLQEKLREQEHELSLINRLTGIVTSSLHLQDVYENFTDVLRELISVDFAAVELIDGYEIVLSALSTKVGSTFTIGAKKPLKGTATECVSENKSSIVELNLAGTSLFDFGSEYYKLGLNSVVYMPLIVKGDSIGSFIIASREPNAYNQGQINLLERLAIQISTSIDNARMYSSAQQRARVDELTGIFNRHSFDENLKREINRHSRYGSMFSLIFLDLDNFKSHNDFKGHLSGDKVLIQIGRLIKETIRDVDLPFRYGGDEFAIILPNSTSTQAIVLADRIVNNMRISMTKMQAIVTASIGIATWPNDALGATELVDAADRALYYAKQTGGNRVSEFCKMLPNATSSEHNEPIERETLNTIYALAATIEARDRYTYGHSRKVRSYAVALAEALKLPSEKVALVGHASLLHDIGKIGMMDEILNKPGSLTLEEREMMKAHPQLSRNIVANIHTLTPCLPAILHHHERWDGNGYPNKLKGESIPLEARILTVADSFDAMTSLRPYRPPMSVKNAIMELTKNAGAQFDPKLVEAFIPLALTFKVEPVDNNVSEAKEY